MLPGFRLIAVAIFLALSTLTFGLGAAALLRASHERFAALPAQRSPPEIVFSQPAEPPAPSLALLRVDEPKIDVNGNVARDQATDTTTEQTGDRAGANENTPPVRSAEEAQLARAEPSAALPEAAAKPSASEDASPNRTPDAVTTVESDSRDAPNAPSQANDGGTIVATNSPAADAATQPQPAPMPLPVPEMTQNDTQIAALGEPQIEVQVARKPKAEKTAAEQPKPSAKKKRAKAERSERRRRARIARRTPSATAPAPSPFAQQPSSGKTF